MAVALCPGSFDPPTNGHIDVIQRAAKHFERVIVSVAVNPAKSPLLSPDERVRLLQEVLGHLDNVEVEAYGGLLVDLARERGAGVIVKGLRALSDVERELQMAQMNAGLYGGVDTFFVTTDPRWSFVSSSGVKEVAAYGGDVSGLVPEPVNRLLKTRYSGGTH
ncbi:MAG TPA: pantetheine-phosphate adenylyltransferase [Actinomycetota bacterium]|nr:pantetheine-phosphate adenylyltransferase [Actinomycetota bacterium]